MINQRDTFKKALFEAMSEKYENELSTIDREEKIVCSKKHYLKLSAIFGFKVNQNKKYFVRILVGILIAALILTGCTAYVYRDEIKEFFVEIYEKHISVTYDNDNKTTMSNDEIIPCQFTYIPEGYEVLNESNNSIYILYKWKSADGNLITVQQTIFDGADFYIDAENGNTEIINYEQYKIYCRRFENSCSFIWNDGVYAFTLTSTELLPNEELFKIIKGIE